MSGAPLIFDCSLLRTRRDRVAPSADRYAFLLDRVADDFVERLGLMRRAFQCAANVGAYHGTVSRRLRREAGVQTLIEVECSRRLLARCDGPKILGHDEALPFAPESLDLIVSALSWQFANDLPGLLAQARRALKPDGLLLAALLGGDTLKELRHAWLAAEGEVLGGASPRVAPFADVRDLGGLLQRAGFALPVADSDIARVIYPDPLAMMRDIKGMAASNMLVERSRVPVTRALLLRACEIYRERYALPDGRVPATFEIITLTAWAPHESQQQPLKPGSATRRLADALGVAEIGTGEAAPLSRADREAKE